MSSKDHVNSCQQRTKPLVGNKSQTGQNITDGIDAVCKPFQTITKGKVNDIFIFASEAQSITQQPPLTFIHAQRVKISHFSSLLFPDSINLANEKLYQII